MCCFYKKNRFWKSVRYSVRNVCKADPRCIWKARNKIKHVMRVLCVLPTLSLVEVRSEVRSCVADGHTWQVFVHLMHSGQTKYRTNTVFDYSGTHDLTGLTVPNHANSFNKSLLDRAAVPRWGNRCTYKYLGLLDPHDIRTERMD
jgi:hypothetical protein